MKFGAWLQRAPSITLTQIDRLEPWHIKVRADDDALAPLVLEDDEAIVDCSDRELSDGEIYAVRIEDRLQLWIFQEGFLGLGRMLDERRCGSLTGLLGAFRSYAPVWTDETQVVGRVIGLADAPEPRADPLLALDDERRILIEALGAQDGLRRKLAKEPDAADETDLERQAKTLGPAGMRAWIKQQAEDAAFAQRFAAERRIDAVNARLFLVERLMARDTAQSVAGVEAKLRMLWQLHYAPFPRENSDLAAETVRSALRSLSRIVETTRRKGADAKGPDREERDLVLAAAAPARGRSARSRAE